MKRTLITGIIFQAGAFLAKLLVEKGYVIGIIRSHHSANLSSLKYLRILDVKPELYRPVDIANIYRDNTSAKEQLGWSYDLDFKQPLDNFNPGRKIKLQIPS